MDSIVNFFTNAFNSLIGFLSSILEWILIVIGWVLDKIYTLLIDLMIYMYDQLKTLVEYFANSTDFSFGSFGLQYYFDQIPFEIQQTLSAIGIFQALTIIASAYIIRIGLRAIPFVGSIFR